MNIMKKRISLILSAIMLTLAVIPAVNVFATEKCQVSMDVKMGTTSMVNQGKYYVKGGETINVSAKSSVTDIAFIGHYFSTLDKDNRENVETDYSNKKEITVPTMPNGTILILSVEAVAKNDNGQNNTITKTGWHNYALIYNNCNNNDNTDSVKDIIVKINTNELKAGSTTVVKPGTKITMNATPASELKFLKYQLGPTTPTSISASTHTVTIPTTARAGATYEIAVSAIYDDGTTLPQETYTFKIAEEVKEPEIIDRDLDIEPWMEENDDIEELSISLRNDSEEEEKANKNIYELDETVTYYIDYKNGGKEIDDDVTIVLELPLDFDAIDLDGGKINDDNEIEWFFENGLEDGEAGTIIVEVKYTDLKKSRDDANTIYPTASILKGNKVKDTSAVINFIITEYDAELDIEHEPYMFGDADADTFRPDYIITRAEGALVLARIYGLDYKNVKTITTKYTDINDTYLEAQQAITAASNAGLINGYKEDDGTYTYRPNSKMTKAEFMKILACMIQEAAEDEDVDGLQIKDLDQLVKIYDDTKRYYMVEGERVYTHWAIEEITLLARLNMLPLNEDNTEFELDEKITRAEVAQLINFYLLRAPADVTTKTKTGFSDVSRKHDLAADIIEATRATHTFSITTEATEVEE